MNNYKYNSYYDGLPADTYVDIYVTSITKVVWVQHDYLLIQVIMGCQVAVVSSLNTSFYLQDEKAQSLSTQVRMITVSVLKTYFILISQSFTQFTEFCHLWSEVLFYFQAYSISLIITLTFQVWPNSNMTWKPENYCGITTFAAPRNMVWTPDIGIKER